MLREAIIGSNALPHSFYSSTLAMPPVTFAADLSLTFGKHNQVNMIKFVHMFCMRLYKVSQLFHLNLR